MMNHWSCIGHQAVFAHHDLSIYHDPSVRFLSCVFLSGEVQMDKGIFGLPTLILDCIERCRDVKGSILYSTIHKFQLKTPCPSQNFTFLLAFARFRHPFSEISFRQPAFASWQMPARQIGEWLPTTLQSHGTMFQTHPNLAVGHTTFKFLWDRLTPPESRLLALGLVVLVCVIIDGPHQWPENDHKVIRQSLWAHRLPKGSIFNIQYIFCWNYLCLNYLLPIIKTSDTFKFYTTFVKRYPFFPKM